MSKPIPRQLGRRGHRLLLQKFYTTQERRRMDGLRKAERGLSLARSLSQFIRPQPELLVFLQYPD